MAGNQKAERVYNALSPHVSVQNGFSAMTHEFFEDRELY